VINLLRKKKFKCANKKKTPCIYLRCVRLRSSEYHGTLYLLVGDGDSRATATTASVHAFD